MKEVTAIGQTVEEAVTSALKQLGAKKEQVEVEILDEGKKGLFRLFGQRPASVKVNLKPEPVETAKTYLLTIAKHLGVYPDVEVIKEGKQVTFLLTGEKIALLIGKRGQTLNALQQLTQLVANRYSKEYIHITLDAENYRKRREETLTVLAQRMAKKAVTTRKPVHLDPLPAFERKIIHAALAKESRVKTFSKGNDPNRYIVIICK